MELELLRKYVEIRSVYEQIYTLSLLMGEIVQADCTLPYYTDEIRLLMAAISPEAARLEPLLSEMETDLFHEMEKLEQILHIPLEKSAMCDLILEIYSREDVPDFATALQLTKL